MQNPEKQNEIVSEHEWQIALEKIFSVKKTIIIGQVDCGKSTFTKHVIKAFLKNGLSIVLLDSDIGQSSIALPGTIGLKRYTSEKDLDSWADRIFFVGFTSPSVSIEKFLDTFSQAVRFAEKFSFPIIVDTTGFVTGQGKFLKLKKIEILKPDLVIAFQRQEEMKDIINEIKVPSHLLSSSQYVIPRAKEQRVVYRKSRFEIYFQHAASYIFPTKLLKGETRNLVYNPQSYIGRIVGLFSEGEMDTADLNKAELCMAVGVIEEIDDKTTVVKSPSIDVKRIKKIILSEISQSDIFNV